MSNRNMKREGYMFVCKFIIIYLFFYWLGWYSGNKYIRLSGDSLFWTCSTIIQGLGALLALIAMFIVYQFQIIDLLIIETHKRAEKYGDELSQYSPGDPSYKKLEELVKVAMKELDDFEKRKNRLKIIFAKPVALIAASLVLSFIALPMGKFDLISNTSLNGFWSISISAYLFPLIVVSIWAIINLVLAIAEIIKEVRIKWSYYRPI